MDWNYIFKSFGLNFSSPSEDPPQAMAPDQQLDEFNTQTWKLAIGILIVMVVFSFILIKR